MWHKYILLICLLVFVSDVVHAAGQKKHVFSYDDYAAVLEKYVDDTGMVNYKRLKTKPEKLEAFITIMGALDPNSYDKWDDEGKIAFWLNAYNALTLKAIIDNYPIKPSFFRSKIYPKNSIRQIPGVWDKMTFNVMGKGYALENIEHKILRKEFSEPRIHMAMVCAAMGCPILRNEPYAADKLDAQLDDQTRHFLGNPEKFKIDRRENKIYLSPILNWFAKDFLNKYSSPEAIPGQSKKNSAVLNFLTGYLSENDSEYLRSGKFKIKYLKYDWSLNEQQNKKAKSRENERG
jgi:hypothetical protein